MNRIENALLMEIEKLKAQVAENDERLTDNIADTVTHCQELVDKGMNAAIAHCQESAAALVTVAVSASDTRGDAICKQMDLMQSLLLNVKALVLDMNSRIDGLETKQPLNPA